jgi:hypothetical protein
MNTKTNISYLVNYVTWIRQGGAVSRIGYVSDTDTRPIRDGYVSEEYPIFY